MYRAMTRLPFFASPEDLGPLVDGLLAQPDVRVVEVYSQIGTPVRQFTTSAAAVNAVGNEEPPFLALWVPAVMPQPVVRRIELDPRKFPRGSWRETTEGCGLFWLQMGASRDGMLVPSMITAFTERGARAKCAVEPGPDAVDWAAHTGTARRLSALIRRLTVARAGKHAVLRGALDRHRAGTRLGLRARGAGLEVVAS